MQVSRSTRRAAQRDLNYFRHFTWLVVAIAAGVILWSVVTLVSGGAQSLYVTIGQAVAALVAIALVVWGNLRQSPVLAAGLVLVLFSVVTPVLGVVEPALVWRISAVWFAGFAVFLLLRPQWRWFAIVVAAHMVGLALAVGLPGNFGLPQYPVTALWASAQANPLGQLVFIAAIAAVFVWSLVERQRRGEGFSLGYLLSLGIVIAVAISLAIVVGTFIVQLTTQLTAQIGQQFLNDAQLEGNNQMQLFQASIDSLEEFSSSEVVVAPLNNYRTLRDTEDASTSDFTDENVQRGIDAVLIPGLRRFGNDHPELIDLTVVDELGTLIYSADDRLMPFRNYANTGWFSIAYGAGLGGLYVGVADVDIIAGLPVVEVAVPIRDAASREVLGVMRANFVAAALPLLVDTARAPDKVINIVDTRSGGAETRNLVINSSDPARVGSSIEPVLWTPVMDNPLTWGVDEFADGTSYIHSHAVLAETSNHPQATTLRWVVIVQQPVTQGLLPITGAVRTAMVVAFGVLALIAAISALFTGLVLAPINTLSTVVRRISGGNLSLRAPTRGPEELGALATAFNSLTAQLADQLSLLQVRVAERTRYLTANQTITQAISRELDPSTLTRRFVRLLGEELGVYGVSVYLLDEPQQFLELRAGYGDFPQALRSQQYRERPGDGTLLGRAIIARSMQLEHDVEARPVLAGTELDAPLLVRPDVDTELVVPLLTGDTVLGALQLLRMPSDALDLRDPGTVPVIETLAEQFSIALNNALSYERQARLAAENQRLLAEAEQNVEKLQRVTAQLSREGWQRYFARRDTAHSIEAIADEQGTALGDGLALPGLREAISQGGVVQHDGEQPALVTPIRIRDAVIGALALVDDGEDAPWSEDDLVIVNEVAEHIALAIENARLLDESQQRLAEQNWLYQVTNAASSTSELNEALRETVASIHDRLSDAGVAVYLYDPIELALRRAAFTGYGALTPPEFLPQREGLAGLALRQGQSLLVHDVRTASDFIPSQSTLTGGAVFVPMRLGDEDVGVIIAESDQPGRFAENDRNLLTTLASTISAVIVNARLLENEQRQREVATRLRDVAVQMGETLDEDEIRAQFISRIDEYLEPDQITLYEWDPELDALRVDRRLIRELTIRFDDLTTGDVIPAHHRADLWNVFSSEVPMIDTEPTEEHLQRYHYRFAWQIGEVTVGVVELYRVGEHAVLRPGDTQLCEGMVRQAANAAQLARLYAEQRETAERLAELDQLKSQFLANMSHELRTPLNSIIGFSRVILKGIDGPITDLQQQDLSAIYNAGQHLLQLINDVLDLSKIEAGKMELAFEDVNLAEMANDVMSGTIRALVKDKDIELITDIEPSVENIFADRIRTRQVLINILGNAAKFTEKGHIALRAQPTMQDGKPMVQVDIEDTGAGIPAEAQKKLFQSFSQVDSSPTRKTGGTGLGLALCKQLVEMHGGTIWVTSAVDQGSTFSFTVPIVERDTPEADTSHLVYVVDNDTDIFGVYQRYLRDAGREVLGSTSAATALREIREQRPGTVILDVELADGDGWALLDSLRTHDDTRRIPVIVCSLMVDEQAARQRGAAYVLYKPVLENDLRRAFDALDARPTQYDLLLIDDKPEDLRLIRDALHEATRADIREAVGGLEGITAIKANPPAAILVDLLMPEIDGYSIIEAVKSDPATRDIPIMVVTGATLEQKDLDRLKRYGTDYWLKDIFRDEDKTQVNILLERLERLI